VFPLEGIIAIDGSSAAGKSTLAALFRERYSATVISMDDFFLRSEQRTPERLGEPGGNIDYERFSCEVIEPLVAGRPFSYLPYDCQTGDFSKAVPVDPRENLIVVEGVYSLHPRFSGVYGMTVFMKIDADLQLKRLAERNPHLLDRFINEWIPMENLYFNTFEIEKQCDYLFC
jgi:uridine kinase